MSKSTSVRPEPKDRFDNYNHWVKFDNDEKRSRSRCKLIGCDKITYALCTKCEVHLCCSVGRNCFRDFHDAFKRANAELNQAKPAKPVKPVKPVKTVKQLNQMKSKKNGPKADIAISRTHRGQSNSTINRSAIKKKNHQPK